MALARREYGDWWQSGGIAGLEEDITTQLLLSRGVAREDLALHRQPSLRAFLPDPSAFADMDRAAERIAEAVIARETVTIYGDYDVDGATSSALLIRLIRMLGHDARHYIPDRLLEGYGPSGEALLRIGQDGSSLIVTVDCGAMAHEALGMAHDAGIDVIVVDHHKCAPELPRRYCAGESRTGWTKAISPQRMATWRRWASPSCWLSRLCALCGSAITLPAGASRI